MYFIRLFLFLFCTSINLCLLMESMDYYDMDGDLYLDIFNQSDANTTAMTTDIENTTELLMPIISIENKVKNISIDTKINELSAILKTTIHRIRKQYKKLDIVFLIDSSSSVGKSNFHSELKFVTKFLSDFNVSFNYTRVSIVTFSSQKKIVCYTIFSSMHVNFNDIFSVEGATYRSYI